MKLGTVAASLGGASAASAAAGGYYLYSKDTPVSIREALKDSKLISTLSGEALTKQWQEEFKSAKDDIKRDIRDLKDFTAEDDGGKKLESWCLKQMDLDSKKHDDTLQLVKKYCLVRDLASQLKRNNKSLIGKSQSDAWGAVYEKRKSGKSTRADIGLSGADWPESKQTEELPVIQKWCEDTIKESFLASEDKYNKLLKWCTEDGKTLT
ncbi:hypothetical protein MHF_1234 [Mycoplasma haemofelis Ohio2]|uniref:Lipoprotein n=1 Tax=Mycoplasma haemofelis (strain Ohio2) TaxID=859194 RepID=F6FFQ4_MYCHI|nr:hypothetical protein MHF_1234 [Mycoplasma haemofelis Ohio2]